jgi:hypothetical protein
MRRGIDVESNETEELARFVAAARKQRPRAWHHVERLKSACALTTSANPELRDLLRRVWRLESEVEDLRRQSRFLLTGFEQAARAAEARHSASMAAANANAYAESAAPDERITP